jgi:hypothetical protein
MNARKAMANSEYEDAVRIYTRIINIGHKEGGHLSYGVSGSRGIAHMHLGALQSSLEDTNTAIENALDEGVDGNTVAMLETQRAIILRKLGNSQAAAVNLQSALGSASSKDVRAAIDQQLEELAK